MKKLTLVAAAILLLAVFISQYCSAQTGKSSAGIPEQDVMKLSMDFTGYTIKKIWEGEIDERRAAYITAGKAGKINGIVVVIQDDYPKYFKRIEYIDEGADKKLDLVKMKVYKAAQGWKDIGITKENKYGLGYADTKYNEILKKIKKIKEENK